MVFSRVCNNRGVRVFLKDMPPRWTQQGKFRGAVSHRGGTHTKVLFRHAGVQLSLRRVRFIENDAWKPNGTPPRHPAVSPSE
jgi:hypothetical protein